MHYFAFCWAVCVKHTTYKKSTKEILVRNKYLMPFTCSTVDVAAACSTQNSCECHICLDCNVNMMKLQIQDYWENTVKEKKIHF